MEDLRFVLEYIFGRLDTVVCLNPVFRLSSLFCWPLVLLVFFLPIIWIIRCLTPPASSTTTSYCRRPNRIEPNRGHTWPACCLLSICPLAYCCLLSACLLQGADDFVEYARELSAYLQTLEQRLFSEGLHTIGHAPTAPETEQYLAAYFGDDLPAEVLRPVRLVL